MALTSVMADSTKPLEDFSSCCENILSLDILTPSTLPFMNLKLSSITFSADEADVDFIAQSGELTPTVDDVLYLSSVSLFKDLSSVLLDDLFTKVSLSSSDTD